MGDVLERRLTITAARDCHDGCVFGSPACKPGSGGSHGVHGSELRMYVIGPRGATQFVLYTNWMWPETTKRFEESFGPSRWGSLGQDARSCFGPRPADLGYHAYEPQYEGQVPMGETCDLLNAPCYYDGSGLQAEGVFETLTRHGIDGVWNRLEAEYAVRFGGVTA